MKIEWVDRVMDYHRRTRVKLANPKLHAMIHVMVENQLALGEATSVPTTLERLWKKGLTAMRLFTPLAASSCVLCSTPSVVTTVAATSMQSTVAN
jgi:hypothetical protein